MPRISRELYDVLRRAGIGDDVIRRIQSEPEVVAGQDRRQTNLDELRRLLNRPPGEQTVIQNFSSAQADYVAGKIVEELQRQTGIPIKSPPQNAPPFHAEPFSYVGVVSLNNSFPGNIVRFGCRWQAFLDPGTGLVGNVCTEPSGASTAFPTEAEQWPAGQFGVVTHCEVYAGQVESFVIADPTRQVRWSLLRNGTALPGYQNTIPTSSAATWRYLDPINLELAQSIASLSPNNPVPCFVPIHPGDRIEIEVKSLVGGGDTPRYNAVAVLNGYRTPVEGDGRTLEQFTRS